MSVAPRPFRSRGQAGWFRGERVHAPPPCRSAICRYGDAVGRRDNPPGCPSPGSPPADARASETGGLGEGSPLRDPRRGFLGRPERLRPRRESDGCAFADFDKIRQIQGRYRQIRSYFPSFFDPFETPLSIPPAPRFARLPSPVGALPPRQEYTPARRRLRPADAGSCGQTRARLLRGAFRRRDSRGMRPFPGPRPPPGGRARGRFGSRPFPDRRPNGGRDEAGGGGFRRENER